MVNQSLNLPILLTGLAASSLTFAADASWTTCQDNDRPKEGQMMACTMNYDPVCGEKANAQRSTYGNACGACADVAVERYRAGECDAKQADNAESKKAEPKKESAPAPM